MRATRFGKGDVRGVIASESSNNAKEGGALLPTIAFGVPGSASMALILGALSVGETRITGLLEGEDVLATAAALRAMGAQIAIPPFLVISEAT
mgnify:CR=1 FL=1